MKYVSFGILLQKHVSLRFLLFPANKKIIETLPELQLCFLLERVADPAKQREHWNAKEHLLCYSLHTFNIYSNFLDQSTGPKRQIEEIPEKQTRAETSLFFCSLWKCQTHQSTTQHTSLAAEGQGGMQIQWPFTTWFLCWKSLQPPASCSSGVCLCQEHLPGMWAVWLSPLWGLPGFPAASQRIWGLFLVPLWWDLHFTLYLHWTSSHRPGEYIAKPTCETFQLHKRGMIVGSNRFLSDVMGHSDCASSN